MVVQMGLVFNSISKIDVVESLFEADVVVNRSA